MNKAFLIVLFFCCFLGSLMAADMGTLTTKGHARFRWETRNDVGYKSATHDNKLLRVRPAFTWATDDSVKILFEPQFSRTFGSDGNSGATTDPALNVHRAQIWTNWDDKVHLTIGRQALSYGDQVVLSTLEWSNVARSFDALKATLLLPFGKGKVDIIDATMNTNTTSSTLTDDLTLRGVYSMWNWGKGLENVDLYYLIKDQQNIATADIVNKMWGVRLKSKLGSFDYRLEYTSQNTETNDGTTADLKGEQTDIELGYSFDWLGSRVAIEWFNANDEYDHMMPLAHAYLGIADVLGRSNINGYAFHYKMKPTDKVTVKIDYHIFERDTASSDAITAGPNQIAKTATSYTSASTSKDLGSELDIQVSFKSSKSATVVLGTGLFSPDKYFEEYTTGDARNKDSIKFAFAQYIVKF